MALMAYFDPFQFLSISFTLYFGNSLLLNSHLDMTISLLSAFSSHFLCYCIVSCGVMLCTGVLYCAAMCYYLVAILPLINQITLNRVELNCSKC